MKERIEKVKTHLKENKKVYLASAGGVVVGAVGMLVMGNRGNINIANPAIMNWKPVANTVQVQMIRPGPKAFVVQCLETQKTWPSLRAAAKDLNVNHSKISDQLSGKLPNVHGMTFEKLAEV